MAKKYEVTPGIRWINRVFGWLARRGVGRAEVLTSTGRKSGQPRSTPVTPIEADGVEYLVSPDGVTGWVGNVRTRSEVELRSGTQVRSVRLTEVTGPEVADIVAAYRAREGFFRKYMDLPDNPTREDFAAAWRLFPVFRVDAASRRSPIGVGDSGRSAPEDRGRVAVDFEEQPPHHPTAHGESVFLEFPPSAGRVEGTTRSGSWLDAAAPLGLGSRPTPPAATRPALDDRQMPRRLIALHTPRGRPHRESPPHPPLP